MNARLDRGGLWPHASLSRFPTMLLIFLMTVATASTVSTREIVDMVGRTVTVPDEIQRVYASSPPATYIIYSMNPRLLVGLNHPFRDDVELHLPECVKSLPVVGGWFGQGVTPNLETLLQVKPDIMVVWWWSASAIAQEVDETTSRLHVPAVFIRIDTLDDYVDAYLFLGRLLGLEERGRVLADYAKRTMEDIYPLVQGIPREKWPSVYYAEGVDGLSTDCDKSGHTELIELAGGRNIYQCAPRDFYGMERISIEEVMAANPEVLLVQEAGFMDQVFSDSCWQGIRAVRDRRVYRIPRSPFNWFDRPPSFMRLLGLKWLTHVLHPGLDHASMVDETRTFYKLFLGIELDEAAARKILRQ